MTGAAVERHRPAGLAITEEERRWDHLIKKAVVYANGTMVPKDMVGKPDVVLAGMLMCRRLGLSEDSVTRIDVIEGRLEPPAQMYLGAVHVAGYETRWVRTDNEAAVIAISYPGDLDPLTIEFTIADAQRAGLLDEWVEQWVTFKDAKGQTRNKLEKFVLGRAGVDTPQWAADLIKAGKTKRMDNWHKWPADMLASKAAKRTVRRMAPEVLFGIADDVRRAVPDATVTFDDDDPVDGEIVETSVADPHLSDDATGPVPSPPAGPVAPPLRDGLVPRLGDQATDIEKRFCRHQLDSLNADQLADVHTRAAALISEGRLANLKSARFTHKHAALLLDLIDEVRAHTAPDGSAPAGVADGGVSRPSAPVGTQPDDPERPFE